ncbi:MAG TPA: hypothetical protein VH593_16165 [Ktedonobacteraceae bacterium]
MSEQSCIGHPKNCFEEKQAGVVGAIIHSAQIDPIYPLRQDESAEAGAMNNGPYKGNAAWQAAS